LRRKLAAAVRQQRGPQPAIALSIKPGGSAREIEITGGIKTHGPGVAPIEQHGAIDSLRVAGGFVAGARALAA
jgi:hypothetical protein